MDVIIDSDIMYRDDLVTILYPNIKKGVLVFHQYSDDKVIKNGLMTGKFMYENNIKFNRSIYHEYIFFRAPYMNNNIDYSSIENEIVSLYGESMLNNDNFKNKIWIRVGIDSSFVFSSEIRCSYNNLNYYGSQDYVNCLNKELFKSRKTIKKYLEILHENLNKNVTNKNESSITMWNLYTSNLHIFPANYSIRYPFNQCPIERNSEILVSIPHLTNKYFVLTT